MGVFYKYSIFLFGVIVDIFSPCLTLLCASFLGNPIDFTRTKEEQNNKFPYVYVETRQDKARKEKRREEKRR